MASRFEIIDEECIEELKAKSETEHGVLEARFQKLTKLASSLRDLGNFSNF